MPTVLDVADEAGVSKSSAARVLAGRGSSSPETRRRVEEAAARLGYRPNALARAVVSGSSATIGAIIADVASPFFAIVVRGLTDAARSAGFQVMIANTDNDPAIEASSIELFAEMRVDGIIVAPAHQDQPTALLRLQDSTPVVLLDRRYPALSHVPSVTVDNIGAARLATEHLLDLGHRRIAIVTEATAAINDMPKRAMTEDSALWPIATQRLLGYILAHHHAGVELDSDLVLRCDYDPASAAKVVGEFLDSEVEVGGMFCSDAAVTLGAYRELVDRGLRVPDDISFIGMDDQDWTTLVSPAITVVEQPRYRLGSACTSLLLAQIGGLGGEAKSVCLPATLIERASTAPVGLCDRRMRQR